MKKPKTNFLPHQDLDGLATKEELDARIAWCDAQADMKDRWSDIFAGRSFYLESQFQEQWEDLEKDEQGRVEVDECHYYSLMESLLEDYAMADIYESGLNSTYAWMLGSIHSELPDFLGAIREYMEERELPIPSWVDEDDKCFFSDDEED